MDKSILRITRVAEGWADRSRAYKIVVNGERRGVIRRGEAKTIEVEPGEVEVYLKIDWCRSEKHRYEAQPGSEASFACGPREAWTALWRTTFGRARYMWLEPEAEPALPA